MVAHVDSLTDAQREAMAAHANRWIDIGLSTEPMDLERFTDGARRCYEAAGIAWPGVVVRVPSPFIGAFAAPAALFAIELIAQRGAVDGAVHDAVGDAVRDAVGDAVGGAVRDAVGDADAVRRGTWQVINSRWANWINGAWWAGWQWWGSAFTSYFRDICGLELPGDLWERSRAYEQTAESASYWWPTTRFVMVSDRPVEIHREQIRPRGWASHRLHREDGPAISWRDGSKLYYWHGTRVPGWVIEQPEQITWEKALAESNQEVRRAMIERAGWDLFVDQLGEPIDTAPDPANDGQVLALYRLPEHVYAQPVKLLLCTNGTAERDGRRRRFGLTVANSCRSAVGAAAWTYGLSAAEYRQLERRT